MTLTHKPRMPLPRLTRRTFLQDSLVCGAALGVPGLALAQDRRTASASATITTTGGKVQGLRYASGISAFRGIPYGAPTDGARRFAKPAPHPGWSGVLETVEVGARSPQMPTGPISEVFALDRQEAMSETCLHLNVWTPSTEGGGRPVMFWMHGGGYTSGSGGWLLYDGANLAQSQDVVVVTINHRLNVFGHLYLAELGGEAFADSGMAGMLDIVAALEWVRDNIAAFGGDPGNVTLFGQSGGAGKVTTLLAMPAARGLFHKGIAMSGVTHTGIPKAAATEASERVLAKLGLQAAQVDQLRSISTNVLLDAFLTTPGLTMAPVLDGSNLPVDPFNPSAPALSADIPMIFGSTAQEVNFFPTTPLEPVDDSRLLELLVAELKTTTDKAAALLAVYRKGRPQAANIELYQTIASDAGFRRGILLGTELKAAQNRAPVYSYYFTWASPVHEGKLRAYHCIDIPFAFNNVDESTSMVGAQQERYALATRISGAFATFARTGKPGHADLPEWPAFTAENRATMIFAKEPQALNDPFGDERRALYSI